MRKLPEDICQERLVFGALGKERPLLCHRLGLFLLPKFFTLDDLEHYVSLSYRKYRQFCTSFSIIRKEFNMQLENEILFNQQMIVTLLQYYFLLKQKFESIGYSIL